MKRAKEVRIGKKEERKEAESKVINEQ